MLDTAPPPPASTLHPLVQRLLACHGYAYAEALDALADPRDVLLFLPSHAKAHLETPDIAVVLPELVKALDPSGARLTGAVAGPALETELRGALGLALPALVVVRSGAVTGSIARMRDWDEYLARLSALLPPASTH
ncbi:hydrogenase [Aquabacter sp. L1I39]|uniref:hydrogenase n=1 Tax=Aquabacter sp. L1I39 TaxID=2820278 RepID=UPI001ADA7842|nr:hydrogenase [Aquabacter sp. L1I39]QTL04651.1 hydrogenase [Aquabacter sp. L1I39]